MKIIYFYDIENWAIHNVGKLWLHDYFVSYKHISEIMYTDLSTYDIIWFGFATLFERVKSHIEKIKGFSISKIVVSVHDPIELDVLTEALKEVKLITASNQLKNSLEKRGFSARLISTTTSLPFSYYKPYLEPTLISVSSLEPRKNPNLVKSLFYNCQNIGIKCSLKQNLNILSESEYCKLFDFSNIYICMSSCEGGPIPAMDAMARGCVVLSTKVGQMLELIEDGKNGFLLDTPDDFLNKIRWISQNLDWLREASSYSIYNLMKKRNVFEIRNQVKMFVKEFFE